MKVTSQMIDHTSHISVKFHQLPQTALLRFLFFAVHSHPQTKKIMGAERK